MGVYGEIPYPLSHLNEILYQSLSKPSNDRGEFELDRARSKNNIAENSFALGHEMDKLSVDTCITQLLLHRTHILDMPKACLPFSCNILSIQTPFLAALEGLPSDPC